MVKQTLFAAALATLMAASSARATSNVTNLWIMPASGGVVLDTNEVNAPSDLYSSDPTLTINANQTGMGGSLNWGLKTDNADDPTLTLNNSIDNDSGFAWMEYIVNVTMNKPFSFTNTPTVTLPGGWTINVTAPTGPVGGFYTGTLDLLGGAPVNPGDTLNYSYKVFFSGSTSYSITEDVDVVPVPEPATLALLGLGGLFLGALRLRRRG